MDQTLDRQRLNAARILAEELAKGSELRAEYDKLGPRFAAISAEIRDR